MRGNGHRVCVSEGLVVERYVLRKHSIEERFLHRLGHLLEGLPLFGYGQVLRRVGELRQIRFLENLHLLLHLRIRSIQDILNWLDVFLHVRRITNSLLDKLQERSRATLLITKLGEFPPRRVKNQNRREALDAILLDKLRILLASLLG